MKTLKIREETHKELTKALGELVSLDGEPKTYDEVILSLIKSRNPRNLIVNHKIEILKSANIITETHQKLVASGQQKLQDEDTLKVKKETNAILHNLSVVGGYLDTNGKKAIYSIMKLAELSLLPTLGRHTLPLLEAWAKVACGIIVDTTSKQPFKLYFEFDLWNTLKTKLLGERARYK